MKLIFTVTNDLNYDQRMIRICSVLSENGHEVCLVGRKLSGSKPIIPREYKQIRLLCFFEKGKLFYIEYNIRLFIFLLFQSFEGVCGIDLDTSLPTVIVAKLKKKKHYYDAHELFPYVPEVINRPKVQQFWQWVERYTFKHTDVVYTVSQSIADYFQEKYQKNVALVRNMPVFVDFSGLPRKDFSFNIPEGKFILYQGALNEGRGLEKLIDAIKGTNHKVVIVGEGDLSQYLRQKVAESKMQDQVYFLGFIQPEMLNHVTKKAYLGYNVSENMGLSYYYSLNNKFFDYVMSELPSIINDFPEYTKLVAEYQVGHLVDESVDSLKHALKLLFEDEDTHAKMKEQCKLAKRVWNWSEESLKLVKIYTND